MTCSRSSFSAGDAVVGAGASACSTARRGGQLNSAARFSTTALRRLRKARRGTLPKPPPSSPRKVSAHWFRNSEKKNSTNNLCANSTKRISPEPLELPAPPPPPPPPTALSFVIRAALRTSEKGKSTQMRQQSWCTDSALRAAPSTSPPPGASPPADDDRNTRRNSAMNANRVPGVEFRYLKSRLNT